MANTSTFNTINIGAVPNDRTGDDIRTAFQKVNNNFSNISSVGFNVANIAVNGIADVYGTLNIEGNLNIYGSANYYNISSFSNLHITGNIPSVSTTTGALIVTGGIGATGNINAVNLSGTLLTSAQPNITSVGTLTNLAVTGNISGATSVSATSVSATGVTATNLTGTLQTAAQPGITSTGTLTSLNVSGTTAFTNTNNSTAFNNGSVVISGGLGIAKDVYVQGNLYVANLMNTSTQTLTVQTSLLYLQSNNAYPYNYDIGMYGHYVGGPSNAYVHTGVVKNDVDGLWYFFSNCPEPIGGFVDLSNVNVTYDRILSGGMTSYGSITSNANVSQTLGNVTNWWSSTYTNNLYATNHYGTLQTAAQPNITSVGTLTSLALSGAITGATSVTATNLTGTLQTAAQPTITSVGTLTSLAVTGNVTAGNLSATNLTGTLQTAAQPTITTVGNLTSLSVGGTSSHWGAATFYNGITGTLQTAAQPNITSVGTLNNLSVTGTLNGLTSLISTNITGTLQTALQTNVTSLGNLSSLSVAGTSTTYGLATFVNGITGTLQTPAQPNITSVGTLTSLALSGAITGATSVSATGVTATNLTGTLQTAAQPNITSVGTLTGLSASGTIQTTGNVSATYFVGNGALLTGIVSSGTSTYSNSNVSSYLTTYTGTFGTLSSITTSGTVTVNSNNNATAIVNGGTSGSGNIGSSTSTFNTVFAKATTAQYADLAEKYLSDSDYEPGTVVVVGGEFEITSSSLGDRAIGVISTNPAYMMNSTLDGGVYVALKGRVPCKVTGIINKGDRLVASNHGCAKRFDVWTPNDLVFGIALQDNNNGQLTIIEAIIL